ncbi:MAG: hypothetical protein ACXAB7_01495, partial [Candidatus Kariarchaeaceae archaeon]
MYVQEHRPVDIRFTKRGMVLIWNKDGNHYARYIQVSVFNIFQFPKLVPQQYIDRDTMRTINRDKYREQPVFNYQ